MNEYGSRRGFYLYCEYWKAQEKNSVINDIVLSQAPQGHFNAKWAGGSYSAGRQYGGGFMAEMSAVSIRTQDDPDLSPNDLIKIRNEKWIVMDVQRVESGRNEYNNLPKETIIRLRKGA